MESSRKRKIETRGEVLPANSLVSADVGPSTGCKRPDCGGGAETKDAGKTGESALQLLQERRVGRLQRCPDKEHDPDVWVQDQMYIKSAVSDDVDLCMECFSVGVEINDVEKTDGKNPHKNDHPYRVMERLDFPLITEDWTAREEVALLEGIETYGMLERNGGERKD
eukprot:767837-Hanusia_phi.AAC.4